MLLSDRVGTVRVRAGPWKAAADAPDAHRRHRTQAGKLLRRWKCAAHGASVVRETVVDGHAARLDAGRHAHAEQRGQHGAAGVVAPVRKAELAGPAAPLRAGLVVVVCFGGSGGLVAFS